MKIVLFTGGFPVPSEPYVTAQANGLAAQGHTVTILAYDACPVPYAAAKQEALDPRVWVQWAYSPNRGRLDRLRGLLRAAMRSPGMLRS